jgi:adenylosuccinate synthase
MPLEIVIGTQWGDEGKGRVVDLMAAGADYVARFNGGDNAGHTVTVDNQIIKLHLIPSGIVQFNTTAVMGCGMVINPATLLQEFEHLEKNGVEVNPKRLRISHAAHLITPAHRALDRAQEQALNKDSIGTTGRGIGPAYTDRASRRGIRMEDMLDRSLFRQKILAHMHHANRQLQALYGAEALDAEHFADEYLGYAEKLGPYIDDVGELLWMELGKGKRVLAEGAQGTLLDLDHGTYPFVTSSTVTACGVFAGLGLGIMPVLNVVGVTKAFQTRVGSGPFPTEVFGDEALRLRGTGTNPWDEFGTTTGRPRRVGWLDGVLLRYAARINGLTSLVITKLDILSGLEKIKICTAYRAGQRVYEHLPMGVTDLKPFEPVYEELPGWQMDLREIRSWKDLPEAAQTYVKRVAEISGAPLAWVSVGPERSQLVKHE